MKINELTCICGSDEADWPIRKL